MMDDDYMEGGEGPRQPPWFLLTGLVVGIVIGLLISLVISPVHYSDTAPSSLASEYKDNYRLLIAQAYQANSDLLRAQQRLTLLGDANPLEALAAQAQRLLAEGENVESARVLAALASALSAAANQPTPIPTQTTPGAGGLEPPQPILTLDLSPEALTATSQVNAQVTRTPMPTFTPRANPTQLPTLGAPFSLDSRAEVCDPALQQGLLQIELKDQGGQPVAGVQITVAWEGGLDSFYTGLKPSISPGYADFVMSAGVVYSLRVGDGGETIKDLAAPQCPDGSGGNYLGGLRLEFSQH